LTRDGFPVDLLHDQLALALQFEQLGAGIVSRPAVCDRLGGRPFGV